MARARNPEAERKAKEKKQKVIAAVGGVLLLALLGFQGPKVMAKLHQKPPPLPGNVLPPNGNPPGVTTPSLAAPSLAGGNAVPAAGGGGTGGGSAGGGGTNPAAGNGPASKLAVFEVAPDPVPGQLRSFSRFVGKDPFQQQIKVDASGNEIGTSGGSPASGSGSPAGSNRSSGGGSAGSGSTGSAGSTDGPGSPSSGAPTAVTSVRIAINGAAAATVSVGSDFPSDNPAFHLLSATTQSAKVTIAGGSYADGRSSVTLRVGKPVTLQNTADGTRYKLLLLGAG